MKQQRLGANVAMPWSGCFDMFRQVAMADGPQKAPALHNPAGVAEGKEAVQGAAEVGAAPPLPEAVRRGRWVKRHLLLEAQEPPGQLAQQPPPQPAGQLVQQPPPQAAGQLVQQPPPSPAGQLAQQPPPSPTEQLTQQPPPPSAVQLAQQLPPPPPRRSPMMVEWDMAVGAWHHMEEQTGLITQFCHMGPLVSYRKVLSYDGVPENSCDQGNWVYAVCLRHMLCLFGESDWRYVSTKQLNDETAGDILEAIWGLLWHRETQGRLASVIADSLVPTQQLQRYCKCMTRVVLMFVQVWPHFIKSHEWPSSEELANALI